MKIAYPIDANGDQSGPTRRFSDQEWLKIKAQKPCRWVLTEKETVLEEVVISEPYKEVASTLKAKKRKTKNKLS